MSKGEKSNLPIKGFKTLTEFIEFYNKGVKRNKDKIPSPLASFVKKSAGVLIILGLSWMGYTHPWH